jgi:hypothetical protein
VSPRWCEHWRQFVFTLPGNGIQVSAGETVKVTSIHDAISVHYMVVGNAHIDEEAATSSMKSSSSPPMYDRIGALGDQSWHSIIRAAVDKAVRISTSCSSLFLVLIMNVDTLKVLNLGFCLSFVCTIEFSQNSSLQYLWCRVDLFLCNCSYLVESHHCAWCWMTACSWPWHQHLQIQLHMWSQ